MNKDLKNYLEIINKISGVLQDSFKVKKIAIFGSTSRGEHKSKSDIDIIVEFIEPIGLFEFVRLEDYLGKKLGKKVDLTTKQALNPTIKKVVLKEAVYA